MVWGFSLVTLPHGLEFIQSEVLSPSDPQCTEGSFPAEYTPERFDFETIGSTDFVCSHLALGG